MLRTIYMDVSPYFINVEILFQNAWKIFINSQNDRKYVINFLDDIKQLIQSKPNFLTNQQDWLDLLGEEKYQELKVKFEDIFNFSLSHYFETNCLNEKLIEFVNDVNNDENCSLFLVTSNKWLIDFISSCKLNFDLEVKYLDQQPFLTANSLIAWASENDIMCNEIACITQVKQTIDDLVANHIFCVSLNDSKHQYESSKTLLILNSLDDLIYSNLNYNFYSCSSNDNEDL